MARVDYDKQSAVYDRGRSMPPESVAAWMVAARRHVPEDVGRVLDLGSGTGRFSAALAETFDADVVGVEPSRGMQRQAATKPHARVRLVAAAAEALPLADATFGIAWLSNVVHHFDDVVTAARELRRVVTGPVFVRGAFAGRRYDLTLYRFFPDARDVVESMPTVTEIVGAFENVGFGTFLLEGVSQVTARSYAEAYEATKARADTALELISDEAFERGLAQLADAARDEAGPVTDTLDLLIVR
jgi:SAM-dependent methyltransferase